jgi:hypothetical protein
MDEEKRRGREKAEMGKTYGVRAGNGEHSWTRGHVLLDTHQAQI